MEFRKIHHVAITHDSDAAILGQLEATCGLHVDHAEEGPGFIERMWPVGESHIQTLEPTGAGVIQKSLETRGPGLHHIAFEVDDVTEALEELRGLGVRLIDEAARPGGNGTQIAFIHPSAFGGVLVELVQEP